MKHTSDAKMTAKSTKRPGNKTAAPQKQRLQSYAKQMVTLLALQQTVVRNLQREIEES